MNNNIEKASPEEIVEIKIFFEDFNYELSSIKEKKDKMIKQLLKQDKNEK